MAFWSSFPILLDDRSLTRVRNGIREHRDELSEHLDQPVTKRDRIEVDEVEQVRVSAAVVGA